MRISLGMLNEAPLTSPMSLVGQESRIGSLSRLAPCLANHERSWWSATRWLCSTVWKSPRGSAWRVLNCCPSEPCCPDLQWFKSQSQSTTSDLFVSSRLQKSYNWSSGQGQSPRCLLWRLSQAHRMYNSHGLRYRMVTCLHLSHGGLFVTRAVIAEHLSAVAATGTMAIGVVTRLVPQVGRGSVNVVRAGWSGLDQESACWTACVHRKLHQP